MARALVKKENTYAEHNGRQTSRNIVKPVNYSRSVLGIAELISAEAHYYKDSLRHNERADTVHQSPAECAEILPFQRLALLRGDLEHISVPHISARILRSIRHIGTISALNWCAITIVCRLIAVLPVINSLLVANGYEVTEIDPLVDTIPEDADIVVIDAPLNDYDTNVIDMLYDFLDNGGNLGKNLIYLADYTQKSTANIDVFLAEWGIKVEDGVVGDQDTNNLQGQSYYVVRNYITDNDYSGNVAQTALPVIDYQSRPITLLFDSKDTRSTVALLQTKDTGFVMTEDMQADIQNGNTPNIVNGVQTTMALGRKYVFDSDNNMVFSNVLVIGSSETMDEAFTSTTYYNNGDYFVSVLNTMAGKNSGISIVAKDLSAATFDIDKGTVSRYMVLFVLVIPLAVLIVGAVVFIRRRTK